MSVPLYWSAEDLPIGVMFTGRPEDETMTFSLAAQLELARPWRERRAPVFVGKKNSL
jgi:Asp-tRNA(Asn)/Glu-tRNA(Gln) amidotransferase A subunit family amidase